MDDWWEPRCEEIAGFWANVRQDTRQVLGIVGDRYRIVQNVEAFQFVDELLGSSLHFETAGSLHDGRKVWVLAQLPEQVEIGGDPVRCYVLLMNSQRIASHCLLRLGGMSNRSSLARDHRATGHLRLRVAGNERFGAVGPFVCGRFRDRRGV